MGDVRIITDSACDLPHDQIEAHGIIVVPLTIRFGDEEFTDGLDLSSEEFWKRCRASKQLPETAAPSPGAFQAAYERAAAEGASGVVAITLSSGLSATFQSAKLGAEAVAGTIDVRVVDSRTVTAAQGLLALEASVFAATGASVDEVASHAERRASDAGVAGTLDTLEHLIKGGRVGGAKALVGSLLSVKPLLTVKDGLVAEDGRQRTRARALEMLATKAEAAAPFDWVAVGGGDAKDIDVVIERIRSIDTAHPLIVTQIGPVVGTHGGPGIIGICWLKRSAS
jgi:DegV family protein with EDD domain